MAGESRITAMDAVDTEIKNKYKTPSSLDKENTEETKATKTVNKVVNGRVSTKKKSLGAKIIKNFLSEDIDNVGEYIVNDVLIPAAKDLLYSIFVDGLSMSLYGEAKRSRRDKSYTNYSNCSYKSSSNKEREKRQMSAKSRNRFDFDDIDFESKRDAEEVLDAMADLIKDYGTCSVADFYGLAGIDSNFTDNKYGWDDLRGSRSRQIRGGWILELPKPILID